MPHHRANAGGRFPSARRIIDDLRYIGRGVRHDFATIRGRNRQRNNHRVSSRGSSGDDVVGDASLLPRRSTIPRNVQHDAPQEDPDILALRNEEFLANIRSLADESRSWNSYLAPAQQASRLIALNHYRTTHFVRDLADGNHDEITAALQNQEYDSYYSEMRTTAAANSESAALALGARVDPHPLPGIALTIPPLYESTDLPPYTATILPPEYSSQVLTNHTTRDVPPCTSPSCPIQQLSIEHSCGLYHHNGQVGPATLPQGTWLPTFGQSNPPPIVWIAYHYVILGIAKPRHHERVAAFVRYHGHPWRPKCEQELPTLTQASNGKEGSKRMPASTQDPGRTRRIPYPQALIPISEIENQGLEQRTPVGVRSITEDLMNALDDQRPGAVITAGVRIGDSARQSPYHRAHRPLLEHQQSRVDDPADAPPDDTTWWINPSALPTPLRTLLEVSRGEYHTLPPTPILSPGINVIATETTHLVDHWQIVLRTCYSMTTILLTARRLLSKFTWVYRKVSLILFVLTNVIVTLKSLRWKLTRVYRTPLLILLVLTDVIVTKVIPCAYLWRVSYPTLPFSTKVSRSMTTTPFAQKPRAEISLGVEYRPSSTQRARISATATNATHTNCPRTTPPHQHHGKTLPDQKLLVPMPSLRENSLGVDPTANPLDGMSTKSPRQHHLVPRDFVSEEDPPASYDVTLSGRRFPRAGTRRSEAEGGVEVGSGGE
ncbi:MAG: hypothetical protein Q9170_008106 [Blastenia crenularia]